MKRLLALSGGLLVLTLGCAPTRNTGPLVESKSSYTLTVDNSRCPGTYRSLFIYRNNVILGQVQGEPRAFLEVPAGSADYKAVPVLGNSRPIQKTLKLQSNELWIICP